ncbi:MAG: hypothetical protein HY231_02710 [Acidobacteria bacterium]|nr:hypothetical protein [Acidobacteriota bacterium]
MVNRRSLMWSFFMLFTGLAQAQTPPPPDIAGEWTGVWSAYHPAKGEGTEKELCKKLTCKVEFKDSVWQAIFEGDCGRPYKYTIKMEGRQVGKVVLFKGTTDLGAKDGGVYDWIGRANDKEFIGFYTSAYVTGVFTLSRTK